MLSTRSHFLLGVVFLAAFFGAAAFLGALLATVFLALFGAAAFFGAALLAVLLAAGLAAVLAAAALAILQKTRSDKSQKSELKSSPSGTNHGPHICTDHQSC